jgi:hypothetical protein
MASSWQFAAPGARVMVDGTRFTITGHGPRSDDMIPSAERLPPWMERG